MGLLDKYTAKYDSVATHSNLDTSLVSADKKILIKMSLN